MRQWHGKTCRRRSALLFVVFRLSTRQAHQILGPAGFQFSQGIGWSFHNFTVGATRGNPGASHASLSHEFDSPWAGKTGRLELVREAGVRSVGPVLVGAYHGVVGAKIAEARVPETRMKNFPLSSLDSGTYSLISSLPPRVCNR